MHGGNSGAALLRATPRGRHRVRAQARTRRAPTGSRARRATTGAPRGCTPPARSTRCRRRSSTASSRSSATADAAWVAMRDVGDALLADDARLSRAQSRRVLDAAAALHATFSDRVPDGAASLRDRLGMTSPAVADAERTQRPAAEAVRARLGGVRRGRPGRRRRRPSSRCARDPAPLADALLAAHGARDADPRRPARRQPRLRRRPRRPDRLGPGDRGHADRRVRLVPGPGRVADRRHARRARSRPPRRARRRARRRRGRARDALRARPVRLAARAQRARPPRPGRDGMGSRGARLVGAARPARARARRRPGRSAMTEAFRHTDAARTIVFGAGALDAAADLLGDGYTLLTTARAAGSAPLVAERAAAVVHVPGGLVEVVAAALRPDVTGRRLVALGGGRVIDVAKALAAADGPREVLAIPTSLSAAEMTRVHRHAEGVPGDTPRVRPGVVVNDPALSASLPEDALAAGSANALAHATVGLLSDRATPIGARGRARGDGALRGGLVRDRARPPGARPGRAAGRLGGRPVRPRAASRPGPDRRPHGRGRPRLRERGAPPGHDRRAACPPARRLRGAGRSAGRRARSGRRRTAGPRRGRRPRRDRDGRRAARPGGPGGAATPGARPRRARARRGRAPRHLPRRRRAARGGRRAIGVPVAAATCATSSRPSRIARPAR